MAQRIARTLLVGCLIGALVAPPAIACGNWEPYATFTAINVPGAAEAYAHGKVGIPQPTYYHLYLYAAYRNLAGKPFTAIESKQMDAYWGEDSEQEARSQPGPDTDVEWAGTWMVARAKVLGADARGGRSPYSGPVNEDRDGEYISFYNCLDDAFRRAVTTLEARVNQFGASSPYVRSWIDAQDAVFQNCGRENDPVTRQRKAVLLPVAAQAGDPDIIRQDRAYQMAAAHLYGEEFAEARTGFEEISKDASSPYHALAAYLVARTLVREGTLTHKSGSTYNYEALQAADKQLRAILADKNLPAIHEDARRMLAFVSIRLHPNQHAREMETELLSGNPPATFQQDFTDYLWLLDHAGLLYNDPERTAKEPAGPLGGDMTDWILSFQGTGRTAFTHSYARWQQTHSLPWLVAAITQAGPKDPEAARLEMAAAKVAPSSPGYAAVEFHRLRLLELSGKEQETRKELDRELSTAGASFPISARNQFLAMRMKLSTNLDELLRFAQRMPDVTADPPTLLGSTAENAGPMFDADGAITLTEKLPLRRMADAAKSEVLPAPLRRDVAIAAWTRAVLLKNEAIAVEIAPVLAQLAPVLKPGLDEYVAAKDPASRDFAAVLILLRTPRLRPFVSDSISGVSFPTDAEIRDAQSIAGNVWWCGFATKDESGKPQRDNVYREAASLTDPLTQLYSTGTVPVPGFLSAEERAARDNELQQLASQEGAPVFLGQKALDWAKAHPDDPRVPEALHLVVHATRYGCHSELIGEYSKAAFDLLHMQYPKSDWAKRTPYWFN